MQECDLCLVNAAAENLQLDLNLYLNNQLVKTHAVKTEEDKIQTVTADGILKFDVTPSLNNQIVTLTSTLYKFENGSYNKFQEPKLMVNLDITVMICACNQCGHVYVPPHRQ